MEVNRNVAMKLWQDLYGDSLWAQDCFGTWMYRDDYGSYDHPRNNRPHGTGKYFVYGWDVDHILPIKEFGGDEDKASFWNNLEPLHHTNNLAKADKTSFEIGGRFYEIVKCQICSSHNLKGYGIQDASTKERIDWMYITNSYYQ